MSEKSTKAAATRSSAQGCVRRCWPAKTMPAKTKAFLTHCLGRIAFKRNLSDAAGLTRSNPVYCPAIYQFPHYLRRIVPKCHERVNCFQPVEMARVPLYWVAEANFLP